MEEQEVQVSETLLPSSGIVACVVHDRNLRRAGSAYDILTIVLEVNGGVVPRSNEVVEASDHVVDGGCVAFPTGATRCELLAAFVDTDGIGG